MKDTLITQISLSSLICSSLIAGVNISANAQTDTKPNVLLIMLDDLNDFTGFLGGHPQAITPNMDKLAQNGIVFTNAHSNAPVSAPSRSSLLTGIYPHTSLNYGFAKWHENPVLSNSKTLMKYMGENGYVTYGTGKLMHHLVQSEWTEFGIKHYFGPYAYNGIEGVGHPSVPEAFRNVGLLDGTFASLADIPTVAASGDAPGYTGWYDTQNNKPFNYVDDDNRDQLSDEKSADWAINKLQQHENSNSDQPFFIGIGFARPHTPLIAPQKYFDMFPLETLELPTIKEQDVIDCFYNTVFDQSNSKGLLHYAELKASYPEIEEGIKRHVQAYLACITYADVQVGKVLDALKNSKFDDNTIVILSSDHGYNQGEKEYLFKNSLWEESTRVPMIIRAPGMEDNAGKQVSHPVSLIDIYPTIADLCELSGSTLKNDNGAPISGYSMKPFLENPEAGVWDGPNVALSVLKSPSGDLLSTSQNYSVRSKDWRYVRYENGKEELYDHRNDPHEWTNLANNPSFGSEKEEMKQNLIELVGDVDNPVQKTNLLLNPDFEFGVVEGWQEWRNELETEQEVVNNGNYALKFSADHQSVAAFQNFKLEVGEEYKASLYSTFSLGNAAMAVFSIKYFDGSEWVDIERIEMTNDSWQQYEIDFTVEEGKDSIQFSIYRWAATDFYVDDCSLVKFVVVSYDAKLALFQKNTPLFPNPVRNSFSLDEKKILMKDGTVYIYDSNGKFCSRKTVNQEAVDVSDLNEGLYFVRYQLQNEETKVYKFVKLAP